MAARKAYSTFICAECGDTMSERTMWVDDGGFLCRHCAILSRYGRMRGEGARMGQRPRGLGCRGRNPRPLCRPTASSLTGSAASLHGEDD